MKLLTMPPPPTERVVKSGISTDSLNKGWQVVDSSGLLARYGMTDFQVYGADGSLTFQIARYRLRPNGDVVEQISDN
jgi:hypothetical protein